MNPGKIILLCTLWLAGCAGSGTPMTRYLLPEAEPASTLAPEPVEQLLLLRPPQLAPYLTTEGIVMQLDPITLTAARNHQWAAPLAHQLQQGLRQRLAARLPRTRILSDAGGLQRQPLVLQVEVDHFLGRYDGRAVASGRWQLRGGDGELLALEGFNVESPLESDGYPALVHALGRSWDRVADQIGAAIRGLP